MIELIIGLVATLTIQTKVDCFDMNDNVYAYYDKSTDIISLCDKPAPRKEQAFFLFHEIGHHYRFKVMTPTERGRYTDIYNKHKNIETDFVREFSATSVHEDFADSFAAAVMYERKGTVFKETAVMDKKLKFVTDLVNKR